MRDGACAIASRDVGAVPREARRLRVDTVYASVAHVCSLRICGQDAAEGETQVASEACAALDGVPMRACRSTSDRPRGCFEETSVGVGSIDEENERDRDMKIHRWEPKDLRRVMTEGCRAMKKAT